MKTYYLDRKLLMNNFRTKSNHLLVRKQHNNNEKTSDFRKPKVPEVANFKRICDVG